MYCNILLNKNNALFWITLHSKIQNCLEPYLLKQIKNKVFSFQNSFRSVQVLKVEIIMIQFNGLIFHRLSVIRDCF